MSARLPILMGQAFLPLQYNTDPFVLIESPRGCLKTVSALNTIMCRAYRWPGKRWYIWRSTRALLSTTVLPSFEEYVIPQWNRVKGMRLMNPNARPTQRSEYIFENGSVVLPIGMDDILRGTSSEGAGGYLAEAIELESADQALALSGMMRQPGVPFHQIICDVNPGPPAHWANQIAEPVDNAIRHVETREDYERIQRHNATPAAEPTKAWKRILARIQDNPYYFDVEKWELTPAGKAYLNTLGMLRGHLRRRWIDGEWVAAEGAVFGESFTDEHIVDDFPNGIPADWPGILAEDPGFEHPTAIAVAVIAPNGRVYIVAEYVKRHTTVPEDAAWLTQFEKTHPFIIRQKLGDPHYMFHRTKHNSGDPVSEQMRRLGHVFTPAPAAANAAQLNDQVQMIRTLLTTTLKDKEPALQVCRSCKFMIAAFQSWCFKRTAKGEVAGSEDTYEEAYKDEMDAVRMIIATNPTFRSIKCEVYPGGE